MPRTHKPLLIALLNDLLALTGTHRIRSVEHLSLEQRVTAPKSKLSIVDVKCTTRSGRRFVVEMQVLPVEGFEKRVVYNASKAYVMQAGEGDHYHKLCDVVGVTICNFKLWPKKIEDRGYKVPMLSRWRMQEQESGHKGLRQIQYAFLELPKYSAGKAPETLIDKWAYFFREAKNLEVVPPVLSEGPFLEALEIARKSTSRRRSGWSTSAPRWPSRTSGAGSRSRTGRASTRARSGAGSRARSRPGATLSNACWCARGSCSRRMTVVAFTRARIPRSSIGGSITSSVRRPPPMCSLDAAQRVVTVDRTRRHAARSRTPHKHNGMAVAGSDGPRHHRRT